MKLRRVNIESFRAIRDREISFEDALGRIRPITVLAGPNGCGKTSVLFAIVQALRGVMGYRTQDVPQPSDLDIHRSGERDRWSPDPECARVQLDIEFQEDEREAIRRALQEAGDALDPSSDKIPPLEELPDGKLVATWKFPPDRNDDGSLKPTWFLSETQPWGAVPWFKGRLKAIQGWRARKPGFWELLERIGGIYLFPQDRDLRSRVVGEGEDSAGPGIAGSIGPEENSRRRESHEQPVWGILDYLSSYARGEHEGDLPEERNWEKRIKDSFRRICAPKEYAGFMYQRDDPVGAPCFTDGNTIYPLQQAASGEQVILEYLVRLTHPNPTNHSLILIDEPEMHLHPGWIRQLYHALPHIGVDNQFVLTTHSLELRAMAAEDGSLVDMGELKGNG